MSPPLAALFAQPVVAADLRDAAGLDAELLYPAEADSCAGFGPKRVADFAAGRLCARRALEELGVRGFALTINPDRTPRWPPAVVGSISHTTGYCCAVAANERDVRSLGVDVELVGRVTSDIDRLVFTRRETEFLSSLDAAERAHAATIIFSAKEAFYKCQYAVTGRWLDFGDASIELTGTGMRTGSFTVETAYETLVLGRDVRLPLRGQYQIDGNLAITAISL